MTVTLNPSDKSASIVLSGGNLLATYTDGGTSGAVRATQGFSSGKKYFEWQLGGVAPGNANGGWASASESLSGVSLTTNSVSATPAFNGIQFNNVVLGTWDPSFASGNWCGSAIDIDNLLIWCINWTQGNGWNNSGNSTLSGVTGKSLVGLTNLPWFPEVDFYGTLLNATALVNFGDTTFSGTLPPGFSPVSPPILLFPDQQRIMM